MMRHLFRIAALCGMVTVIWARADSCSAQTPVPVYWIAAMDVMNAEAFAKEFMPLATKIFSDHGGKFISRGGRISALEGDAPKRIVIVQFPSVEVARAVYASAEYKQARKIGDRYARFESIFTVEVLP